MHKRYAAKTEQTTVSELMEKLGSSEDFVHSFHSSSKTPFWISYFQTLIDPSALHHDILPQLQGAPFKNLNELTGKLPFNQIVITEDNKEIENKLLEGYISIQTEENKDSCLLIPAFSTEKRDISLPEVEFSVLGPKDSFVESIDSNINLVRKRLPDKNLTLKEFRVGSLSKTKVAVIYIEGIADPENVNTMIQRIRDIEYDHISDSAYINQMIEDNSNSPFPQLIDTERPDRVTAVLAEGKVAVLVDGSPTAITGPTTLIEFFSSFDDYFLSWHIASAFRLIRLFAVAFSVLATPIYVAVITYHAALIPRDLLSTLIMSREAIPFPPIIEAIFLELTIELLREAGARLPTKVGQTIGIVGGIVIGTAAVEAGLTSNVLLIIVALAALASFTTPIYRIGNTIRLIRFPFLLIAQLWGVIGISLGMAFLLVHLLGLTSLGRPYLAPIYPLRLPDLKDSFIRLPFTKQSIRPKQVRPQSPYRFNKAQAQQKKDIDD
ncbi:spore germination protein [Bacillus sp. FJAT-44742]|uniref:spore germination protein n=1 Tax=Bacillus sp. FJAT-44742 TaxID=2014005 RepID=UPI001E59B2D6|nr:spore germination protein [Bacillus sp. FJAT-44742]